MGKYGYRAGRRKKEKAKAKPSPTPSKKKTGFQPSKSKSGLYVPPKATREKPLVVGKPLREQKRKTAEAIKKQVEGQRESFYQEAVAREQARTTTSLYPTDTKQLWKQKLAGTPYQQATAQKGAMAGMTEDVYQLGGLPSLTPESKAKAEKVLEKLGNWWEGVKQRFSEPQVTGIEGQVLDWLASGVLPDRELTEEEQLQLKQDILESSVFIGKVGTGLKVGRGAKIFLSDAQYDKYIKAITQESRIAKVPKIKFNTTTTQLAKDIWKKALSPKTITILLALGITENMMSSITLGLWGGAAEAGEGLDFLQGKALIQAKETGDYTLYNDIVVAVDEINNPSLITSIALGTPLVSGAVGSLRKRGGRREYQKFMARYSDIEKQLSAEGLTGEARGKREAELEIEAEEGDYKESTDYFNQQAIIRQEQTIKAEKIANKAEREEQAQFWKQHKIDMMKLEEEDRKKIAKFWLNYYKEKSKLQKQQREEFLPSNLKFGLL